MKQAEQLGIQALDSSVLAYSLSGKHRRMLHQAVGVVAGSQYVTWAGE